jgi:hypothetical protein
MAAQCHRKCCLRAVGDGSTLWAPTSSQPVATPAHVGGGEKCVSRTQPLTLVAALTRAIRFVQSRSVTLEICNCILVLVGSCVNFRSLRDIGSVTCNATNGERATYGQPATPGIAGQAATRTTAGARNGPTPVLRRETTWLRSRTRGAACTVVRATMIVSDRACQLNARGTRSFRAGISSVLTSVTF